MLAAQHGSFRRTAELLNVPQSTVTRRIQLLERRIGISLFERSRSGARVTAAGNRFLKEAAIGAEHLQQAVKDLALIKRGHSGQLCIGIMSSLASGFLAELFASFHRQFPAIDIKFEEATSQANAGSVLNGRLDAAFLPGEPRLPGCRAERLWEERIYVVLRDAPEIASKRSMAWTEIKDEVFLTSADCAGPEIQDYLVRILSSSGFHPRISIQHVGRENLINMVGRGFGITLTTSSTLGAAYAGVRFLPVISCEDTVASSMIWSLSNTNPALKLLVQLGLEHSRQARTL